MCNLHKDQRSNKATEAGTLATIAPERGAVVNRRTPSAIYEAWRDRAKELAQWVWDHLVNRTDVWGGYFSSGPTTHPPRANRGKIVLTQSLIERHFRGTLTQQIVGLHSTAQNNTSISGAVDLDNHDDSPAIGAVNLAAALTWYNRLRALGFNPLLTDSNGAGGYHLRVIMGSPAPTPAMFAFLQSLITDWKELGLPAAPETFPKQATIGSATRVGCNWLRIPGRHHKREHYSRVWDGARWLDGAEAVAYILAVAGDSPDLIPAAIQAELAAQPEAPPASGCSGKTAGPHSVSQWTGDGLSPLDDFDKRGPALSEIVGAHGWKLDADGKLTRPGKDSGPSATITCRSKERGDELFYVFTSNAPPFEKDKSYGRSRTYAILNHGGDLSATTRELAAMGYGTSRMTVAERQFERDSGPAMDRHHGITHAGDKQTPAASTPSCDYLDFLESLARQPGEPPPNGDGASMPYPRATQPASVPLPPKGQCPNGYFHRHRHRTKKNKGLLVWATCGQPDCPVCGPLRRQQWKDSLRRHLNKLRAKGRQKVWVAECDPNNRRQINSLKSAMFDKAGSYVRLNLLGDRLNPVIATEKPPDRFNPHEMLIDDAFSMARTAIEHAPYERRSGKSRIKTWNSSDDWKLLGEKDEQTECAHCQSPLRTYHCPRPECKAEVNDARDGTCKKCKRDYRRARAVSNLKTICRNCGDTVPRRRKSNQGDILCPSCEKPVVKPRRVCKCCGIEPTKYERIVPEDMEPAPQIADALIMCRACGVKVEDVPTRGSYMARRILALTMPLGLNRDDFLFDVAHSEYLMTNGRPRWGPAPSDERKEAVGSSP